MSRPCLTIATNSDETEPLVSFQVLTAPAKEFKTVYNSISKVIQVMVDNQLIRFSEVWNGVATELTQKTRGSKYKNNMRRSKHMYYSDVLEHKWRASLKLHYWYMIDFNF